MRDYGGTCYILFLLILPLVNAQLNCSEAPTPSLKIVCGQIKKWDEHARSMAAPQSRIVLPPGISSLSGFAADLNPIARTAFQCMSLGCLCNYMGGSGVEGSNQCRLADGQPLQKVVRREYRTLSDEERERFHTAVRQIKANGEYDRMADTHSQFAEAGGAHSGPAFLPWHREYIKRFEIALRKVDPTVALPYWDSVLENNLPRPTDSMLWTDMFMGSSDASGNVIDGTFANWRPLTGRASIVRRVGAQGSLFRESEVAFSARQNRVEQVLAFTAPRQGCPIKTNWNVLEFSHGNIRFEKVSTEFFNKSLSPIACRNPKGFAAVTTKVSWKAQLSADFFDILGNIHIYVGGDMLDQSTSANDPVFFLHHSFVDMIWEIWRLQVQSRSSRETDFPMDHQLCSNPAHFGSNLMRPFEPMRNADGLSNEYTDNLYEYAPRPVCPSCGGSKYLFCMRSSGPARCAAKIRPGGSCQGLNNADEPCFNGQCQGGTCVAVREIPRSDHTPPQATPRTSSMAAAETCYNEHECCSVWQQQGECTKNRNYMRLWCKASCGVCRPHYDLSIECSDRHINCARWSQANECSTNPNWMNENCRESCHRCSRTRAETCGAGNVAEVRQPRPTEQRPEPRRPSPASCNSPGCYNEDVCCPIMGLQGQCTANATFMSCQCKVSCGICSPRDYNYGTCEDYHPSCAAWSEAGECDSNPWMLENCRSSCGSCFSPNELRRMCRGSFAGMRPTRRPRPETARVPWMQRRPPPPMGPEFDLATGINVPGIFSLRWGRETNEGHKQLLAGRKTM